MTLSDPFWLVLAIPAVMLLWLWPMPTRLLNVLRSISLAAMLLALCGLGVWLPVRSGTVVLVADRSLSMPADSEAQEKEAAGIVHSAMRSDDRLAVVAFGETATVEQSPQTGKFAGFTVEVGREASHLADALDLALSLVDRDETGRLLVVSDGLWTGRDLASSAARAAAAGVAIDYRAVDRVQAGDLAIQRIQGPDSVLPGESFMLTAWIQSPIGQTISYELQRGSQIIARGKQDVPTGASRLLFRDTAVEHGVCQYALRIQGDSTDPVPENNRARLLVGVRGARPVLCVNPTGAAGFSTLLERGGLDVKTREVTQCRWTLEELAGFSAVILENTPATRVGQTGMENLAAWVAQSGGGLMLTGGRDSYGPGGYYKSPLEPILPVSMELRREHRKLSLAMVVALDRSGSMAMTVPDGRRKIELANLATAEVVNLLSPTDQFGCLAVDSSAHEIVPLTQVVDKESICAQVLRIDSMGGGIFIYEALKNAAAMIAPAQAGAKHIILFADAADSEQPEDYRTLLGQCAAAGITVTVIGLGTEQDCDAELLKDVARLGGGECMFTNIAQELPRLFAQDTMMAARSAFLDTPVAVRPVGGLMAITRQSLGDFPEIGGYNLCYLRPTGKPAVVSEDEYQAPIVASWQAGLGRVLCYTGEADGKYTGPIAKWTSAGDFFTSLGRWTAGKDQGLGRGVVATQELRNGVCRVELHLDPDRETTPFANMPELTVLSARPGEAATSQKVPMHWATADTLLAELPLAGSETLLPTLVATGMGQATLAPTCLPYSPEYLPQMPGRGASALQQLAAATGGCERLNLADIWNAIPRRPRHVSLAPYLLMLAVVVFLLEVLQRRTGILSFSRMPAWLAWRPRFGGLRLPSIAIRKRDRQEREMEVPVAKEPSPPQTAVDPKPTEDAGMFGALNKAQKRARQRTDRE